MNNGIIGIFYCEEKGTQLCSVSVRSSETPEELERAVQSEHPNVNLRLERAISFECNCEVNAVEKGLRKLLIQVFGNYTPSGDRWEYYRADREKVISFINNVLDLCKCVTDFKEQKSKKHNIF